MFGRTSLLFCVWVSLLAVSVGQRAEQLLSQNPCSSKTTCSDCVRTPACAWCFAHDFNGLRCFNPSVEGGTAGCDEAYVFNPDNQQSIDPMYYRELTRGQTGIGIESSYYEKSMSSSSIKDGAYGASAAGGENFVQIKPQRVKLQLRTNEMHRISFSYAQAQDYPVDLYYLMDLRKSMNDHKKKLSTLGRQLSNTMRNITSNFRIGFGSFGDKLVSLKSPCDGCAPYSFKNRMPLSSDTDFFDKAVADAEVSGNLDAPQGGLNDAIMQAVVCKSEIGWREHARKLLVISTDAGFHYAGDGKLGDIVQPNDGQCHMAGNSYTYSTTQDYPSISQINLKVKKHAINVIFAVTAEQIGVYEQLSKHIEGSSSGVLSDDSHNVVDLVRDQYNKITSTVQMKDTSSNALQISYYSSCLGHKDNVVQTNRCDGLKVSDVVKFSAEITLKECPKEPSKWKQSFTIYPVGVSESLNVEVEMLCDCPCEHPGHHAYDDRPEACSGHGISACGECVCNPGSFGKRCECAGYGDVSLDPERGCRPTSVRQNRGRGNAYGNYHSNLSAGLFINNCICYILNANKIILK